MVENNIANILLHWLDFKIAFSNERFVFWWEDEKRVEEPGFHKFRGVEFLERFRAARGCDLAHGRQAGDEDSVRVEPGRLVFAQLDQPIQPIVADNLLGQIGVIAQSEKKKQHFEFQ